MGIQKKRKVSVPKSAIQIESEHADTVRFIKHYLSKHKKLPPNKMIYRQIALNHIKEIPTYYIKLKKAKL